jgi:trimethylguanosine synthase
VLCDFFSFVEAYNALPSSARKIDVVFLSPPWGGPSYLEQSPGHPDEPTLSTSEGYSLSSIRPVNGSELFRISRTITKNIAYYLPRNTKVDEISELLFEAGAGPQHESVEIEEEWMGNKLKALTAYFGGLAQGQEDRF